MMTDKNFAAAFMDLRIDAVRSLIAISTGNEPAIFALLLAYVQACQTARLDIAAAVRSVIIETSADPDETRGLMNELTRLLDERDG